MNSPVFYPSLTRSYEMKSLLQITGLVALALVATGCASKKTADEALATANEAKSIAANTQAQFDRYFAKTRYK